VRRTRRRAILKAGLGLAGWTVLTGCGLPASFTLSRPKVWQIGLYHVGQDHVPASLETLRDELANLGYLEGTNLKLDWRNLANETDAQVTAREFVSNGVDLIVAFENQTMRASRDATSEIPVVFLHVDDPVANGWIESLAHPGGNLTGFVGAPDLPDKRIEYFKLLAPSLQRLLVLADPGDPTTPRVIPVARKAMAALGIESVERDVRSQEDLDRAFVDLQPGEADGVFLASRSVQTNFTTAAIRWCTEKRLPLASHRKEFVEHGALFSYGPDQATTGRVGARLIDKILKGARPATLPVERMDVIELVINLGVARQLGLTIPQAVVTQADSIVQ
jgi:putative ABC transport system substrate-binding protein